MARRDGVVDRQEVRRQLIEHCIYLLHQLGYCRRTAATRQIERKTWRMLIALNEKN